MTVWILEPRDPLIVRDGRPFGPDPGARATSLLFPFPSTLAGGLRSRAGLDEQNRFRYTRADEAALDRLKRLAIRGPLLVQLKDDEDDLAPDDWLVPAPRDAALFPSAEGMQAAKASIQQQLPLELPEGAHTDLDQQNLQLVGAQSQDHLTKPCQDAPVYWYWQTFQQWALNPSALTAQEQNLADLGLRGPTSERRLHVSIEGDTGTARDGMLFETAGLEFTAPGMGKTRLRKAKRLALAIAADDRDYAIRPGLTGFGGERRFATWRKSHCGLPPCWPELEESILKQGHCRLFLLTPACFSGGWKPAWLLEDARTQHVEIRAQAIAIKQPQVVSGWDLALGKPKPSRRLAPAGSVFFLALSGSQTALRAWIRETWMHCISDDEQDRRDGFGLAALGSWSGELFAMGKEAEA